MATTKETMKVIANGIEQKNVPETILEGKIIRLDLPEEAAEALAEIFSLIEGLEGKQEYKVADAQENNNGAPEDDDDYDKEPTETEELVDRIAAWTAYRAVEHLMKIAEDLTTDSMLAIVKCIEQMEAEGQILLLKSIFLSHGMNEAAEEMRLLDICLEYDEDAAYYFEDAFFDTPEIDWYSIENLIRDKTGQKNDLMN